MKILHAEYGGLVIYNMKLKSGTFRLSDINCEGSSASLPINWSEFTLIVHGNQCVLFKETETSEHLEYRHAELHVGIKIRYKSMSKDTNRSSPFR